MHARTRLHRRKVVTIFTMTLLVMSLIFNFASPIAYGSSTTTFYVDPSSVIDSSLTPGNSFIVDVNVSDAIDLFAWQIYISWDGMVLSATDIVFGDFLAAQPCGTVEISNIDNPAGLAMIAQVTLGQYSGVDGDGWLCSITFLVETLGETILDIDNSSTLYTDSVGGAQWPVKENGFFSNIGASTTELMMNETTSSTHALTETIICQSATLNTSVSGDFDAALNFTNLDVVLISSGSFAGKGFSTGTWSTHIEGNSYEGSWKGMLFKKPRERRIHLKGMVSGGLKGIVEGFLSESINGSEIYDRYQATWTINHIGAYVVCAKLNLNGTVDIQESFEYSSELYALQTYIQGEASGYYNGSSSMVLTHVRVNNETNPYYGEGFSIISYDVEFGSGEGWTYDKLVSPNIAELNGLSADPLRGIVSATLDESGASRNLTLAIERIDLGLPPVADLKVRVWGPQSVSPGQKVKYIIECSNYGLKAAENVSLILFPSLLTHYVSASPNSLYDEIIHAIRWDLTYILPRSVSVFSYEAEVMWGLQDEELLIFDGNVLSQEEADQLLQHDTPSLTDTARRVNEAAKAIVDGFLRGVMYILPGVSELIGVAEIGPPGSYYHAVKWAQDKASKMLPENAFRYLSKVETLLNTMNQNPTFIKDFHPGETFYSLVEKLAQEYGLPDPTHYPDFESEFHSSTRTARDPNIKYGPDGYVSLGQRLNYTVEYENEGEGIAFGVYFTDTLDKDLDDSTLEIGPVISTKNGSVVAAPGTYDPSTRTITWFVGEVGPGEGGHANFSAQAKNDAPEYTEIINYVTVYFPSVPETTRTNAIVSIVGQPNIAVSNVTPSEYMIEKGFTQDINVAVVNKGYFPEAFNVTLYANTTAIQTQNATLLGRTSGILAFLWNTTGFAKGNYTLSACAWPVPDEVETDDNLYVDGAVQIIVSDDISPTTDLIVGEPKFVVDQTFHLTSITPITLIAEDDPGGSGVASTAYRIYNAAYDGGWTTYTTPFYLIGLGDGAHQIAYNSTDYAGNVELSNTVTIILDNAGPSVTVENPPAGWALQDGVTFIISAVDASGTSSMNFSIREADGGEGTPVGFEDLPAVYDAVTGKWTLFFDTLQLPDGYYIVIVKAEDNLGHTSSTTVSYSIRNWAVLELLPASENNKAGRTMPVKFALRVAESVDPDHPFVYNEDLTISIYASEDPGNILQTSTFGDTARDYRINTVSELYITNFRTLKTPMQYTVAICRGIFIVGSFEFSTTK